MPSAALPQPNPVEINQVSRRGAKLAEIPRLVQLCSANVESLVFVRRFYTAI
jgi:hypothetical protein